MIRPDTRGFALVAVLWVLAMVGVIGVGFQARARADRQAAANTRSAAQARWAARAGLAQMMSAVDGALHGNRDAPSFERANDVVLPTIELTWRKIRMSAVAIDARSRVNLNLAGEDHLSRLFIALGLRVGEAGALADAIVDWRDPDPLRRPHGAEASEYVALRPSGRPKNAPFERVDELRRVIGIDPALYRRLSPYLTVVGDGRININSAPAPVLATLSGIDGSAARAIVERRQARPFGNPYELLATLPRRSRGRIEGDMDRFIEAISFSPRDLEIHATAAVESAPVGARLWASMHLYGGAAWALERIVER